MLFPRSSSLILKKCDNLPTQYKQYKRSEFVKRKGSE